jgi:autoinducer 2-degrading protein
MNKTDKNELLVQLVTINVQPGSRGEFLKAIHINLEGTRQEPGNVRFDVLSDPGDENCFSIYEVFKGKSALESHRLEPHYQRCMALLKPIILGDITKLYFTSELI